MKDPGWVFSCAPRCAECPGSLAGESTEEELQYGALHDQKGAAGSRQRFTPPSPPQRWLEEGR